MSGGRPGRAEDYTGAFLGMAWLLCVFVLTLAWGLWGYAVALALGAVTHAAIRRLGQRRAAREADWDARVDAAMARGRGAGR